MPSNVSGDISGSLLAEDIPQIGASDAFDVWMPVDRELEPLASLLRHTAAIAVLGFWQRIDEEGTTNA